MNAANLASAARSMAVSGLDLPIRVVNMLHDTANKIELLLAALESTHFHHKAFVPECRRCQQALLR